MHPVLRSILELIKCAPGGSVYLRRDSESLGGFNPRSFTEAPYLKWVISGRILLGGTDADPVWLEPGQGVAFARGSFANLDFPEGVSVLRATLDEDSVLVGIEAVDPGFPNHQPGPVGNLNAIRVPGPWPTGMGSLIDRLYSRKALPGPDAFAAPWWLGIWGCIGEMVEQEPEVRSSLVEQIEALIEARFARQVDLESAAEWLGVSSRHLNRTLNEAGRPPFNQMLLARRMKEARHLLRTSSLSIGEVGIACGFQGSSYFSQAFRLRHDESPGSWRKRARRYAKL